MHFEDSAYYLDKQPCIPGNMVKQVCGNDESVKFLNEWLRLWHVKDFQISNDHTPSHSDEMQDKNYSCSKNDSDSEGKNKEASRTNVLLVTGPVGVSTNMFYLSSKHLSRSMSNKSQSLVF